MEVYVDVYSNSSMNGKLNRATTCTGYSAVMGDLEKYIRTHSRDESDKLILPTGQELCTPLETKPKDRS